MGRISSESWQALYEQARVSRDEGFTLKAFRDEVQALGMKTIAEITIYYGNLDLAEEGLAQAMQTYRRPRQTELDDSHSTSTPTRSTILGVRSVRTSTRSSTRSALYRPTEDEVAHKS